ncbi:hypothetical protein [Robiginitalea sediminis]|uniref:hypothetical protein n=1 Tax=Robiginitalea sediminis TaxID=1982593 RepID=UPI00117B2DBA|nr:hypothetical protein [Robiginitalea sediminis]
MKGSFWTTDKIVSLVAMGISLLTLVIFVRQTDIIEQQSHLSVMPYLRLEMSNDNQNHFTKMELFNYGVGPAIIESRELYYKGQWLDMEFADFFRSKVPEMQEITLVANANLAPGQAIPSGGTRLLLQMCDTQECHRRLFIAMQALQEGDFDYRIRYRSIYGDRWEIRSGQSEPLALQP